MTPQHGQRDTIGEHLPRHDEPHSAAWLFVRRMASGFRRVLGHPETAILVVRLICAPFWPMIAVGMFSVCEHRPRFAFAGRFTAKTECGPVANTRSSVPIGASGSDLNVLEATPCLMFVCPSRSS